MAEHMSIKEFKRISTETRSKFRNKVVYVDGKRFDSKLEAHRYHELKIMVKAGLIKSFKRQPSFLFESGIRYRPDFIVWDNDGICWVEDAKGFETKEFKMKVKLWALEYPDMELWIIK